MGERNLDHLHSHGVIQCLVSTDIHLMQDADCEGLPVVGNDSFAGRSFQRRHLVEGVEENDLAKQVSEVLQGHHARMTQPCPN